MAKQIKYTRIKEYDNRGNLIYIDNLDDNIIDRDDHGRIIRSVNKNTGYERCYKYNENGNLIYYKNNKGKEWTHQYDERDNLVYKTVKNVTGDYTEYWYEYDESNRLIHFWDSHGYEQWLKYDINGNIIYQKDNRNEIWKDYDERGNLIHSKIIIDNNSVLEWFYEYDKNNNTIFLKKIDVCDGDDIFPSHTSTIIERRKYNENNILIYEESVIEKACEIGGISYENKNI